MNRNYVFNGSSSLRELENVNLAGVHLPFNGPFDLRDLTAVDLRNTTIVINDYSAVPPCASCGNVRDGKHEEESRTLIALTPDSQWSMDGTDEQDQPVLKRSRTREPSEDGELVTELCAQGIPAKPQASEVHPQRMAMLKKPIRKSPPPPPQIITKTKANREELPFNRLERRRPRQTTQAFTGADKDQRLPITVRASAQNDESAPRRSSRLSSMAPTLGRVIDVKEASHTARINEERVENFLRTLEPAVTNPPQQSETYGRLSPATEIQETDSEEAQKPEVIAESPLPLLPSVHHQLRSELRMHISQVVSGEVDKTFVSMEMDA